PALPRGRSAGAGGARDPPAPLRRRRMERGRNAMVRKRGERGRGRVQEAEGRETAGTSLGAAASARDPAVDKARRALGVAQYPHRRGWMAPTEGLVYQERVAARIWEEISAEDWGALGFPAPALLDPVFARAEDWAAIRRAEPRSFATAHALLDLVDPA